MNAVARFLLKHRLVVFAVLVLTIIFSLLLIIRSLPPKESSTTGITEAISPTQQTDEQAGLTGGTGEPTEKTLILSNWDLATNTGQSPASVLPIEQQNRLTERILAHYLARHSVTDVIVQGAIGSVALRETTLSFMVTVGGVVYAVNYTPETQTLNITQGGGVV